MPDAGNLSKSLASVLRIDPNVRSLIHDAPMHKALSPTTSHSSRHTSRRHQIWLAGLLLGMTLFVAHSIWNSPATHPVQPVRVIELGAQSPTSGVTVQIVPYQFDLQSNRPDCPATQTEQLCLVIGTGSASPQPMTFT